MDIKLNPIGYVKSPYKDSKNIPRQAILNKDTSGVIAIEDEYLEGIDGIEKGSFIEVIFYFHKSEREALTIKSMKSGEVLGVFATRAPHRPNHLGISIVEVENIKGNKIKFKGVDMLDGTPIIDIKPMNEGLKFS